MKWNTSIRFNFMSINDHGYPSHKNMFVAKIFLENQNNPASLCIKDKRTCKNYGSRVRTAEAQVYKLEGPDIVPEADIWVFLKMIVVAPWPTFHLFKQS